MPDYYNGKIYKIVCDLTGSIYVGSTCNELHTRLCAHVSAANRINFELKNNIANPRRSIITSREIINNDCYRIELLEYFPCYRKRQLLDREAHYIRRFRTLNMPVVNKNIPGRSLREYCEDNKAVRAARDRHFRSTHPDYYKHYAAYQRAAKELRRMAGNVYV
jgi:hypothetical protein